MGMAANLIAAGGAIAMALAGVVSYQNIERPWAPKESVENLVIEVGGLTARVATGELESLRRQLLANRIAQGDLKLKGLRVDDAYRIQELGFKNDIAKLERELKGLKK